MKKEKNELRKIKFSKIYVVLGFLIFLTIIYRIGVLSLSKTVEGVNIQNFANSRTTRQETLSSKRGTIYDVKGNALAQNVSSYTLIAYLSPSRTTNENNPKHVVDKELTAEKLSTVLDISKEKILSYLNKDAYQVELGSKARNLTELKKDEILALELPGIDFIETQQRYYPYGTFLSYTLGYATKKEVVKEDGSTSVDIVGEMGVESYFNKELTGENGYTLYQKDRKGYRIPGTKEITVDAIDGKDIYLTIDSNIQLFVEQAIAKMLEESSADWVSVMLADAKTGAILASATYPSFDPNTKNISSYLNQNITAFEPGSTMKIFSYMAAMENGVYNGTETYKSGIFVAKDGTEIGDWYRKGWGYITYDAGFALSSNVAVMTLTDKYMNAEMLRSYYRKLGFGEKTGIELPNESTGKLNFKYQTEILNASFGQGITTTPIQNIKALTSITNDGILLKPYIVEKIVDPDTGEVVYEGKRTEIERVASTATVTKIKELMRSVVNGTSQTSTGYYYYMDGYDLIAKTGTAQVANEYGTGYTEGIIRGLAGIFPGNDPRIIMYVAIKNPSTSTKPTKNMVQSIIKNVSKYLEIYEENDNNTIKLETVTVESYTNKKVSTVLSELNAHEIKTVVLGDGDTVVSQYPSQKTEINKIDRVFLLTNNDNIVMPDMTGYSLKDVYSLMSLLKIPYEINGNGYVINQSVPAGTKIESSTSISIELGTKF